ncbi:MAG: phosphoglycerate kinase [Saprospiraceae bacterium]|nr:phosphoglycerate kinase [Saprospiraceae bacterium]
MSQFDQHNFKGERALIRVDFNVPLDENFKITDDTRMRAALPTINKILNDGGSVVLMSHFGRPKDGPTDKYSLKHLKNHLSDLLGGKEILFADDCIGEESFELSANLQPGQVLLLENLRFYKEEEKGDEAFAEKLSKHGDFWVNDAFGTAHRAHASTTIVSKFFPKGKKSFGYLMEAEVINGNKLLNNPAQPVTAIVGGAKVSDKIKLLEKLIPIADNILIGGGMAYTFIKALGGSVGKSICEYDKLDLALDTLEKAKANNCQIHLPEDTVVADKFAPDANKKLSPTNAIEDEWEGLDIGPKTAEAFSNVIKNSKTILWNGPMGVFEFDAFAVGTFEIAKAVADATALGAYSLIGGGDSVSAINKAGLEDKVSYVSTGGGAMLEFLEGKTLPGIAAVLED